MIPLLTKTVPATGDQWSAVLRGLCDAGLIGPARATVDGDPPALMLASVDASGCRLADRPPPAAAAGPAESAVTVARFTVARFTVAAHPLVVRDVPVKLDASADRVRLDLHRDAAGGLVATVMGTTNGHLSAHVAGADLDAAVLAAARAGAAGHGVEVRAAHATLTARSPRDVEVTVELTVKKFVTFALRLTARVTVDAAMTATATGLTVDGTGMAAKAAAAVLRPQLAKADGRPVPLAVAALGNVRLRDLAVDVTDGLRVTATFGAPAA